MLFKTCFYYAIIGKWIITRQPNDMIEFEFFRNNLKPFKYIVLAPSCISNSLMFAKRNNFVVKRIMGCRDNNLCMKIVLLQ